MSILILWLVDGLIEQCLTSPPTQYRLFGNRSKDPIDGIKVLKEKSYKGKPRKAKNTKYTYTYKIHNKKIHI